MNKPKELIEKLEDAGYEWRSYSGRGMFGKSCVGVTLRNDGELFQLGADVGNDFGLPTTDSMGLGIIAYWPRHKIEKQTEEEDTE